MTESEKRSYENMVRTARRMLERTENRRDIAACLYQYQARTLCGGGGILVPGDYMCDMGGCLVSSRGMAIPMDAAAITEMVDGGALDKLFSMDDLNAPDFSSRFEKVLAEMDVQRHYHDASCYYKNEQAGPGLVGSVAVYDVPEPGTGQRAPVSVESTGGRFAVRPGVRDDLVGAGFRQCTYEEFNPGGRELVMQAEADVNAERQNTGSAYEKLKKDYLANGENEIKESGEVEPPDKAVQSIPGYDRMSATEKLAAMREATDRYDAYQKSLQEQAATRENESAWTPTLPGSGRMGDI